MCCNLFRRRLSGRSAAPRGGAGGLDTLSRDRESVGLATDAATIYNLYRRLIATRRLRSSVNWMLPTDAAAGDLLLFVRRHEDERTLVALNFGSEPLAASFTAQALQGQILMSTLSDRVGETVNGEVSLRPHEGLMIDVAVGSEVPLSII
jgi:hypothetical protein